MPDDSKTEQQLAKGTLRGEKLLHDGDYNKKKGVRISEADLHRSILQLLGDDPLQSYLIESYSFLRITKELR